MESGVNWYQGSLYKKKERDEIKYAGSLRELLGHKRMMLYGRKNYLNGNASSMQGTSIRLLCLCCRICHIR